MASLRFALGVSLAVIAAPRSHGAVTGGVFDPTFSLPVPPEAQSGVVALSGASGNDLQYLIGTPIYPAYESRLALKADGSVFGWSTSLLTLFMNGYTVDRGSVRMASGVTDLFAAGRSAFLMGDGSISSTIDITPGTDLKPASVDTAFTAMSGANDNLAGYTRTHLVALRKNGAVVELSASVPVPASGQSGVQAIAAGTNYTVALRTDGSVVAWTFPGGTPLPIHASLQSQVGSIAAEANGFAALRTDGSMVFQTLDGSAATLPPPGDGVLASGTPSFALTTDRRALTWDGAAWKPANVPGWTQGRILGRSASALLVLEGAPIIKRQPSGKSIFEGRPLNLSVDGGGPGATYQWFRNGNPISAATNDVLHLDADGSPLDGAYTVVIANQAGSITSDPPAQVTVSPAPPAGLSQVNSSSPAVTPLNTLQSASGYTHNLYLFPEGLVAAKYIGPFFTQNGRGESVRSWNNYGQSLVPQAALEGVVEILAGYNYSVALKSDGTVIFWGAGAPYGSAIVSPPSNVRTIAGGDGTWMITSDGGVVTWDRTRNVFTQDGIQDAAKSGVTQLVSGAFNGALKGDGTLVPLGTRSVPAEAQSGMVAFSKVVGSVYNYAATLGAKADGSLYAWGSDGSVQNFAAKIPNIAAISDSNTFFDLLSHTPSSMAVRTTDGNAYYVTADTANPTAVPIPASWQGRIQSFSMTDGSSVSAVLRDVVQSQSIQFTFPESIAFTATPVSLTATASSGLPVRYRVLEGQATVDGNQLTLSGTGTVTVVAEQPGSVAWTAAAPVQKTFTVSKTAQSIQFQAILSQPFSSSPIPLVASASSGLAVSIRVAAGPATLNGSQLILTGVGDVTVVAEQAGTANVSAANPVQQTFTVFKASQTIQFAAIPSQTFNLAPIPLTASASSGLAVSLRVVDGPATLNGNQLILSGVGNVTVVAEQAGSGTVNAAAPVQQTFTVFKASQSIQFAAIPSQVFSSTPIPLNVSATSGLTVSLRVVDGPATLNGNQLTLTGIGDVTVVAEQAGTATINAANPVQRTFSVFKASQTIQFAPISSQPFSPSPIPLAATSSSGLEVLFAVLNGPGTIVGRSLKPTGAGTILLVAFQPGSLTLSEASVTQTIVLTPGQQQISFEAPESVSLGAAPLTLSATASSGLPVTFRLVSGPATLLGAQLTPSGIGTVTIAADQQGDANYNPASITRSVRITGATQTILVAPIADMVFHAGASVSLSASASSGLPVTFALNSGPGVLNGNDLTIQGAGVFSIAASQSGNATTGAAIPVTVQFTVRPGTQSISWAPLENPRLGSAGVPLQASASSGLPVEFIVLDGPAVLENGTLRATGLGIVRVAARQSGNTGYAAAAEVVQSVIALPGIEVILPSQVGGFAGIRVVLPTGQTAVIEQGDALGNWTSLGTVFGFGVDSPIFFSITPPPPTTTARFWRVTTTQ